MIIGIDFDGTIVKHKYPLIGKAIEGAIDVIFELEEANHKIILYTMRSGERLDQAVEYLREAGVIPYAINENPLQKHWTESPKVFCNVYIDDAALGCPLVMEEGARPYVNWEEVRELLIEREVL